MYQRLRRFPASQENKQRDKIKKKDKKNKKWYGTYVIVVVRILIISVYFCYLHIAAIEHKRRFLINI